MFQIEIVEGETVFACNICDEGFDFIDDVNKHIADAHEDIVNHILTRVVDEGEGASKETKKCELEVDVEETQEACTMEMVNGVRLFKYNWCNESFKSVDDLKKHFKEKH